MKVSQAKSSFKENTLRNYELIPTRFCAQFGERELESITKEEIEKRILTPIFDLAIRTAIVADAVRVEPNIRCVGRQNALPASLCVLIHPVTDLWSQLAPTRARGLRRPFPK